MPSLLLHSEEFLNMLYFGAIPKVQYLQSMITKFFQNIRTVTTQHINIKVAFLVFSHIIIYVQSYLDPFCIACNKFSVCNLELYP